MSHKIHFFNSSYVPPLPTASIAWGRWGKGVSFTLIVLSVPIVLSPLKFQQKLERENDELRVG